MGIDYLRVFIWFYTPALRSTPLMRLVWSIRFKTVSIVNRIRNKKCCNKIGFLFPLFINWCFVQPKFNKTAPDNRNLYDHTSMYMLFWGKSGYECSKRRICRKAFSFWMAGYLQLLIVSVANHALSPILYYYSEGGEILSCK